MPPTHLPRKGRQKAAVITNLGESRTAELRDRERSYVISMLFRAVCLIAAVLIFHGPARWFAVAVAIALPWCAVVLANAPKRLKEPTQYLPTPSRPNGIEPAKPHPVIDPDR